MRWVALGLVVVLLGGCSSFFDRTWVGAPEASVERIVTETKPDGTVVTTRAVQAAKGSSVSTNDPKTVKTSTIDVKEGRASVGKASFAFDVGSAVTALYWVGAVVILAGVAVGYFLGWKLGAIVIGAGVGLLVLTRFLEAVPWYILGLPLLLLVGALGYVLYRAYKGQSVQQTLQTVVAAVETAPADIAEAVKSRVTTLAGSHIATVRADVREAKAAPETMAAIAGAEAATGGAG